MPNEIQFEETQNFFADEIEADAQAARLIIERLHGSSERKRRSRRWTRILVVTVVSYLLLSNLLIWFLYNTGSLVRYPLALLAIAAAFAALTVGLAGDKKAAVTFEAAEIARLGGVKAIAPLFVAMQSPISIRQQREAAKALTLLLPQMAENNAYLLTSASRQLIHKWLLGASDHPTNGDDFDALRIATLKALEKISDPRIIPAVERLANMTPRTPNDAKVCQAARECLLLLRAHCSASDAKRTLLRASQAEAAHSAALLRPASGAGQTDTAELLRGADAPDTRE